MSRLALWLIPLLFASCNYHLGRGPIAEHYKTVEIPYVEGDTDGTLTSELAHRLGEWGGLQFRRHSGDLLLTLRLTKRNKDTIGYRYDRKGSGKLTRRLVPAEERLHAIAELHLIDTTTGKTVLGPVDVEAHVDYDHDYYTLMSGVHTFSLGQLADADLAQDMAMRLLYQRLAERVVDYLAVAL